MPFNISEFNGKLSRYGLARDNLFFVTITPPSGGLLGMPTSDLSFFCRAVQLPGLNITTTDINTQGFGIQEKRPVALPLENLNAIFMIDSNFGVKRFFQSWIQTVVNYDNSEGYTKSVKGMTPYQINYKENYTGVMEVFVYSFNSESIKFKYKFKNIFPVNIGNIDVAWENNDSIMTMAVSFAYDVYQTDGLEQSGILIPGDTGYITSLGNFGRALTSIGVNTPIQDIINQYTSVANIVNYTRYDIRNTLDGLSSLSDIGRFQSGSGGVTGGNGRSGQGGIGEIEEVRVQVPTGIVGPGESSTVNVN